MFLLSLMNWRFRPRFRPILYGSGKEPDKFYTSATRLYGNAPQWGEGAGDRGYSGFQVTGMTEGFLCGLEIFDFGIFLGRKILASIFFG